jgi:hypothetical protein
MSAEFVTISASSYDPAALAAKLSEKSAEGWSVVGIVPTGGDITAFLSREAVAGSAAEEAPAAAAVVEAAPEPAAPAPAAEPAGWAVAPEPAAPLAPIAEAAPRLQPGPGLHAGTGVHARPGRGRAGSARRLVRRPGRSFRAALLGWRRLVRARVACRAAVHRRPRRLIPPAGVPA